MDPREIPDPPADYTPSQIRDYYKNYVKRALSLSTTKDDSLAQVAKDAQHEVNQPMHAEKESELPEVTQTEKEVAPTTEVPFIPPPAILAADKPSSSKSDPKEHSTPPRKASSTVHSSGSISGDSEARDTIKDLPSQGTQPGIFLQGAVSTSKIGRASCRERVLRLV